MNRSAKALYAAALGCAAAAAALLAFGAGDASRAGDDALWAQAQAFRRPDALPYDPDLPNTQRIALGEALFRDTRLSGPGTISCATCHDPSLAFTDGVPLGRGAAGKPLARHTPALWNLAWGESYFWDGRADTLEQQARGPIEHPLEMAGSVAEATARLGADAEMAARFRQAFPRERGMTADQLVRALASYERTLVSPRTRFDKWVAGDAAALSPEEKAGFALFTGKAGCSNCHSGWAFSDRAYHDIGLPGDDWGRFGQLGLGAADHAFKTPSLRELTWTAPYMHDGSLHTLERVLDHYENGIVERPSVSADLPRIHLSADERDALLAFLDTLSSETPPVPTPLERLREQPAVVGEAVLRVTQKDKQFSPLAVRIREGETLTVVNDDRRTHNVRMDGSDGAFDTGAQEPGQSAEIHFRHSGSYRVYCGIHPAMQLAVEVMP
ncbi:plastocyanin/azurin family copper-binding protein [Alsobacter sp. SYSU M60028]|uniref:Plastocyanin/azurin family copper-binding protein n=1 Tax=Alsobacter ponti TaxID=2962936 RepID=A0ABT1L7N0_9HYPH|nr:cytochrome c peroxidase [Alsobacter ponti]MCP8937374.1 plastocyanin/azurin family copper-binding protein [Alsobacter ponti]